MYKKMWDRDNVLSVTFVFFFLFIQVGYLYNYFVCIAFDWLKGHVTRLTLFIGEKKNR